MADYNQFCDDGLDGDYCKDAERLAPLKEGPFYIVQIKPGYIVFLGGVITSIKLEVVSNERKPIPGLYATGTGGKALPQLVEMAVSSGTGDVDVVAGATMTSAAFMDAMADALK